MKTSINVLIVVLLTIMSVSTTQAFHEVEPDTFPLSGKIVDIGSDPSTIWIQPIKDGDEEGDLVEIQGFPFRNLEAQFEKEPYKLTITIGEDDCVKIEYYVKDNGVKKWSSLLMYSKGCADCESCDPPDLDDVYCLECIENASDCFEVDMGRVPQRGNIPDPSRPCPNPPCGPKHDVPPVNPPGQSD